MTASSSGVSLDALVTEITTMNDLARKAVLVIDEEFKALEKAYAATTISRHLTPADDAQREDPAYLNVKERTAESTLQVVVEISPSTFNDAQVTQSGKEDVVNGLNGKVRKYVQVVVDCDSLKALQSSAYRSVFNKWNLEINKRGYASGETLIHDLSEVIDHHLSPAQPPPRRDSSSGQVPLASEDALRPSESVDRDSWWDTGEEDVGNIDAGVTITESFTTNETPQLALAPSSKQGATTATTRKKRFTFLLDPRRMMEKNYPLKKDKARLFLAGLDDCEGCELVHIGFGKKCVEDRLRETVLHHLSIDQCAHVFLAVGITSNNQHQVLNLSLPTIHKLARHPSVGKLTVMRSGGPFDTSTGIHSVVAVDKHLSVQTQQVVARPAAPGGTGLTASSHSKVGGGGGEQRERRSFAPSPQVSSHRKLFTTTGQEHDRGVARLQGNPTAAVWSSASTVTAPFNSDRAGTTRLMTDQRDARPSLVATWSGASTITSSPFDADYGDSRLQWSQSKSVSSGVQASVDDEEFVGAGDARIDQEEGEGPEEGWGATSVSAGRFGQVERWTSTPTPCSRMETKPAAVLDEFDPRAILRKYGRPLCAKYHLNNGNCNCKALDEALHDEIILKGSASKQLALWASDRVCPEGPNCPDALTRTCCFWRHEMRSSSGDSVEAGTDESDEWIAVDKKGKPIISSRSSGNGKLARADFNPLMTIIREFTRDRHMPKHERGLIGTELKRAYGHDIYRRLGLAGFKEYTSLAEKAGLVRMGYQGPSAGWIAAA
ncbi:hypothetical protein QFC22_000138 [Naganishia vaughanmartiniae]|uniref:Uncharacterized protein n=1 Tax=Naganishia vaughanmartiniae TaxID=1424756 RepID=A0ACC2XM87_9TREE|nr:hypothetical protein QFC22_000138 [Naganishia vaughanmartiniae]